MTLRVQVSFYGKVWLLSYLQTSRYNQLTASMTTFSSREPRASNEFPVIICDTEICRRRARSAVEDLLLD